MLQLTIYVLPLKQNIVTVLSIMVNYSSMSFKKENDNNLKINFTGLIYIRPPSTQNRIKLKYQMSSNEKVNNKCT